MHHRISVCSRRAGIRILILSLLIIVVMQGQLRAEDMMSYPDRKALIVNNCPYVQLRNFYFENRYERSSYRFVQSMMWTNIGGQSIVAFDIVILKYDAFNERINGNRWTVTGNNSQNWKPLEPGQSGKDTILGSGPEEAFTGIAYVRAVRLRDGTIWRADVKELLEQLREVAPEIENFGDVNGEIKIRPN
jgi:hypothetical protein